MIYLRETKRKDIEGLKIDLEIFEGDIVEDKIYLNKFQKIYEIRYFELKEIKIK